LQVPQVEFNEDLGRRSFEAWKPALEAAGAPHGHPNVDFSAAAARVLGAAEFLRSGEVDGASVGARLLEFPAWALDPADLSSLESKAWACLYIYEQRRKGSAGERVGPLERAELEAARQRRARMLTLAQHHLVGDDAALKELADIRKGSGYMDLARDLSRLASLCEANAGKLSGDASWWRAEDIADARREAARLTQRKAPKVDEWSFWAARAVASLRASYRRVRAAVWFAWPDRPDIQARFPAM
jgi:hypothetical protein